MKLFDKGKGLFPWSCDGLDWDEVIIIALRQVGPVSKTMPRPTGALGGCAHAESSPAAPVPSVCTQLPRIEES